MWNDADKGKAGYILRENPVPVVFYPPQNLHGLTRDQTWSSAVRGPGLIAFCAVGAVGVGG